MPQYAPLGAFISGDRGNDYNNFQPRLGVTWDVNGTGTFVLRSGWGLYVTRNRPWFQLTAQDQVLGSAVLIQDPQLLRNFPDITATLGGRTLDQYIAAGGVRQVLLLDDDYVLPYQYSTTAGFGWQINGVTSLDVDYVHSFGTRQLGSTDRNLPASGPIPAALANLSAIEELAVDRNRLTGPLPAELSRLPNLYYLDFSRNAIGGQIPRAWGEESGCLSFIGEDP